MAHTAPDIGIVDARARDLVKLLAIDKPRNRLLLPVLGAAVELQAPRCESIAIKADGRADTVALITNTTRGPVTVHGSVASGLAVDGLEDIELTAERPVCAVADRVAEHPKGGPDALLAADGGEVNRGLDTGEFVVGGGEGVLALETARRPPVVLVARDDLERLGLADADVVGAPGVHLELVVDAEVARDDVPVALVRKGAFLAAKIALPLQVEVGVGWGLLGKDSGHNGQDGG